MERIKNFFKDESGASAVEYGLLVALIAVVIIVAVTALGNTAQQPAFDVGSRQLSTLTARKLIRSPAAGRRPRRA